MYLRVLSHELHDRAYNFEGNCMFFAVREDVRVTTDTSRCVLCTRACMRTHTRARPRTRTHTQAHTHAHARTHALTHAHTHTHARTHTLTHTNTVMLAAYSRPFNKEIYSVNIMHHFQVRLASATAVFAMPCRLCPVTG